MGAEVLAVIPARGGSVRIPRKNVKPLMGKPLIGYAIEAAEQAKTVTRVIVSTDDDEIRDVALSYGADVPFTRPAALSEDVPTEDVILHAIEWLRDNEGYNTDVAVCLEPPVPFRKAEHIDRCVNAILADDDVDSALTVVKVGGLRPEWMMRLGEGNLISPYTDHFSKDSGALMRFPSSQEMEPLYRAVGIVFACRLETLTKWQSLVGQRCVGVEIGQDEMCDLDEPGDFEICEMLMKGQT